MGLRTFPAQKHLQYKSFQVSCDGIALFGINCHELSHMNWRSLISPDSWKGLARETAWKLAPGAQIAKPEQSWPITPGELEHVRLFWPSNYEWPAASKWVQPLLAAFRQKVKTEITEIPQLYKGIVLIQMLIAGNRHEVAIDYADRPEVNPDCAQHCALYFKMQFARQGYPLANVLPGGFIPNSQAIYEYLPHLRALADRKPKRYDVYGRFGLEFAGEIRRKACSLLAAQSEFHWEGSLQVKRYSVFLSEIARSKICIDLPGNGDFCFRLIDYFAVGACVIAAPHHTSLHVPLIDREHIVYAKENLSDLIDLCRFYLAHDEAREALECNSRAFFDRYLHRDQLAAYYLRSCLDVLA